MNRTRRWEFVKQEANRLAEQGLSPDDIARQIGVDRATVFRWKKAGKLGKPATIERPRPVVDQGKDPAEWAANIRRTYVLSDTDHHLVNLGEMFLSDAYNGPTSQARKAASQEFRAIDKHLNLLVRSAQAEDKAPAEDPKRQTFEAPKRSGGDPRALFQVVAK